MLQTTKGALMIGVQKMQHEVPLAKLPSTFLFIPLLLVMMYPYFETHLVIMWYILLIVLIIFQFTLLFIASQIYFYWIKCLKNWYKCLNLIIYQMDIFSRSWIILALLTIGWWHKVGKLEPTSSFSICNSISCNFWFKFPRIR